MRIYTSSENTTWPNPELQFTSRLGKYIKILCIGTIWRLLRERDWLLPNKIERDDPPQHAPSILYWKSGGNEFGGSAVQQNTRSASLAAQSRTETGLARRTKGYFKYGRKKIQRHVWQAQRNLLPLRRGRCASPNWLPNSRIVSIHSGTTIHAKKWSTSWFINLKRIRIETRWKPTWSKINRITHLAKNQRTWSTAWRMWSTSKCARPLQIFSALIVWRTGRKVSCTAHAEPACSEKLNGDRFDALSTPHYVVEKSPLRGAHHWTLEDNENTTQLMLYPKGKKESENFNLGSISEMLDLQRVTTRDWMGWRLLPILRRSLKWRWYIFLYCKWTSTTWKQLGIGTEQPRSEWSDETTRRPRRSRQNQRSFAQSIWTSQPKNTSHQTSITKSESTVLKIQWRSRTSWSHNRMEMVSIYHLIKFIFNMADINKWVVASIELGCTVIFLFIPKLRRFLFEAMTIPCDRREVQTPHYICVHLHIPHTWTFLAWLKISMVSRQKSSSHQARHVSCTVVVVSVFEVTCTPHSFWILTSTFFWETLKPLLRDMSDSLAEWLRKNTLTCKAWFYSPIEIKATPAPVSKTPEEWEFVVDSGRSMLMLCKRDLSSEELETLRRSRKPTMLVAANE